MNKTIILITDKFPYYPGEQFLETEITYFENIENINFIIMPSSGEGKKRSVNDSILIDNYLINNLSNKKIDLLLYFIRGLSSKYFYKEIFSNNLFNILKIKSFILSIINYTKYYHALNKYFKNKNNLENTIVYTYWNNEITYALQELKNKYRYTLISRIHRGDLYKEVRYSNYMPLKKHFTMNIDKIYTITPSANEYLHKIYKFDNKNIELSRLGVNNHNITNTPNNQNTLHIVSCSSLIEVKCVDKIIYTLNIISKQYPKIKYVWTHIGDGILYEELLALAKKKLDFIENVKFEFKGNLNNKKVYQFYKDNSIDVFINVSKSEGVPVSIMEAMSCHIPIIAPNVGGISDMLKNNINGFLLSEKCEIDEIVYSLSNIKFLKNEENRKKSYEMFLDKYNAKKNYQSFLNKIINLRSK